MFLVNNLCLFFLNIYFKQSFSSRCNASFHRNGLSGNSLHFRTFITFHRVNRIYTQRDNLFILVLYLKSLDERCFRPMIEIKSIPPLPFHPRSNLGSSRIFLRVRRIPYWRGDRRGEPESKGDDDSPLSRNAYTFLHPSSSTTPFLHFWDLSEPDKENRFNFPNAAIASPPPSFRHSPLSFICFPTQPSRFFSHFSFLFPFLPHFFFSSPAISSEIWRGSPHDPSLTSNNLRSDNPPPFSVGILQRSE